MSNLDITLEYWLCIENGSILSLRRGFLLFIPFSCTRSICSHNLTTESPPPVMNSRSASCWHSPIIDHWFLSKFVVKTCSSLEVVQSRNTTHEISIAIQMQSDSFNSNVMSVVWDHLNFSHHMKFYLKVLVCNLFGPPIFSNSYSTPIPRLQGNHQFVHRIGAELKR